MRRQSIVTDIHSVDPVMRSTPGKRQSFNWQSSVANMSVHMVVDIVPFLLEPNGNHDYVNNKVTSLSKKLLRFSHYKNCRDCVYIDTTHVSKTRRKPWMQAIMLEVSGFDIRCQTVTTASFLQQHIKKWLILFQSARIDFSLHVCAVLSLVPAWTAGALFKSTWQVTEC